ncbi:MAG: aspartate--tRNA ligase [Alphaproteobacteria bacterium GM202ARS2]|nr:aspartate--tRNA ligase [Alphaproteobacteria bacterium GM202ARS2]
MTKSHPYRWQHCGELNEDNIKQSTRLCGWLHKKRDHGQLLFLDIRDHYGITQCVIESSHKDFALCDQLTPESVIRIDGTVVKRSQETINTKLPTGTIEVAVSSVTLLSRAATLPFQIATDDDAPEEQRLRYRFLELRRLALHDTIVLRARVIEHLRQLMRAQGFTEIHTPILTATSPEGARDYLVPSRSYPGHFYALPQAPQLFKQLLMTSGFDKYFQIAPCFRDEDARADRSPGEFYQLDLEMAFATQDDVFNVLEPVLSDTFTTFTPAQTHITAPPYPRIPYLDALATYGSDKPDLRNPLIAQNVSDIFRAGAFGLFARAIDDGCAVYAIKVPSGARRGRSWFDNCNRWAQQNGMKGLAYLFWQDTKAQGPIGKNLEDDRLAQLRTSCALKDDDALVFICAPPASAPPLIHSVREKLCDDMNLREQNSYRFCWITDYPMFERDPTTKALTFSHNPFSMPQGGLDALKSQDPLTIKAWQYDIVCNGVELSSGAIRNHDPETMLCAFKIAGYDEETLKKQFGGLWQAFQYGAPPHGGSAPGIERMLMLLTNATNIREVTAFPMNGQARDVMMDAPQPISPQRLKELHLALIKTKTRPS